MCFIFLDFDDTEIVKELVETMGASITSLKLPQPDIKKHHEYIGRMMELVTAIDNQLSAVPITPKSRFLEWTDAGPGVSVTNWDVRIRISQRIRIMDADYFIRFYIEMK